MDSCFGLVRYHQHDIARQRGVESHCISSALPAEADVDTCVMPMSRNKDETTVHGCHSRGNLAVPMRKVLAKPQR